MSYMKDWIQSAVIPQLSRSPRTERVPLWFEEKSHKLPLIELRVHKDEGLEEEAERVFLNLAGEGQQIYRDTPTESEKPGVCIMLSEATLIEVRAGRLTPRKAYSKGLIKTQGSRHVARHLARLLAPVFGEEKS